MSASNLSATITDTSNLTDPAIIHTVAVLALVDGPLGWQQFQTSVSISASSGRMWTISLRTFDLVAIVSAIILLAFAVDHYYFNSRYLVHIGGATPPTWATVGASTTQKKNVRDLESSHEHKYELENKPKPQSVSAEDSQPRTPSPQPRPRCWNQATFVLFTFLVPPDIASIVIETKASNNEGETPKSSPEPSDSSMSTEKPLEKQAEPSSCNRLGLLIRHPWMRKIARFTRTLGLWLLLAFICLCRVLFWPFMLFFSIAFPVINYNILYPDEPMQWRDIARLSLISFLRLTFWTSAMVTLLLRTSQLQGKLWKSFRWTHATTWWLLWGSMELSRCLPYVFQVLGLPRIALGRVYDVALMPLLITAYLYSGLVCNVTVAVVMAKKLWKS